MISVCVILTGININNSNLQFSIHVGFCNFSNSFSKSDSTVLYPSSVLV
jgi:hypothetical protein